MKFLCLLVSTGLLAGALAGCGKKVYIHEERTIDETRPVVTGDESSSATIYHRTTRVDKHGKVRIEEESTTETTKPIVTGD